MSNPHNLPSLPDYSDIKLFLTSERNTFLKGNDLSDEVGIVRSEEQAELILSYIEEIQKNLWTFFKSYSSLLYLFAKDFMQFNLFLQREYIIEICFLDEYLIPEKEFLDFIVDGELNEDKLKDYINTFNEWAEAKGNDHRETLEIVRKSFSLELKYKDLPCQCSLCADEYRVKLRDYTYDHCVEFLESTKEKMNDDIEYGIDKLNQHFSDLKKHVDKSIYSVRYRLKRSVLNRLDAQLKYQIKQHFNYPSEIALKHEGNLKSFFASILKSQGLKSDLIEESEYERFFSQLGSNIWRGEKYLEIEFKKQIRSLLMFKRKDISANILTEYLGAFWSHSEARTIKRRIIYHMGPTNSGKTYHAIQSLSKAKSGCYLAPLRLLAAELYDTMNENGVPTTLLTGEEVIKTENSTHYSSTIEMARFQEVFDSCVIDEIQMIADPQRGWAWTRALVNIFASEVHICGDDSALDLIKEIVNLCGDTLEIKNYTRMTDLLIEKKPIVVGDLQKSDALIVFSRRNALKYKSTLEQVGFKVSIVYGRLGPEVRKEQARKFDHGETDIMVSTDAIAMGMNLPIKRIVFSTLSKFIDSQENPLSDSEIKQIAGRAGRYKRFPTGYISCLSREETGISRISKAMESELSQKTKCMVGPDLDIFTQVNNALKMNNLPILKLSEFLRLFNTMTFQKPFFCVELKEMIELAELVEEADRKNILSSAEIFGFACAPVNLGLIDHVQYYVWILNHYANENFVKNEDIDHTSDNIDYLETSIKCVELYQWLARHFNNKNFDFDEHALLHNKSKAIEKLNQLLSEKIIPTCSSCGKKLEENSKFAICEECFRKRRFSRRRFDSSSQKSRRGKDSKDHHPKKKRKTVKKKKSFNKSWSR